MKTRPISVQVGKSVHAIESGTVAASRVCSSLSEARKFAKHALTLEFQQANKLPELQNVSRILSGTTVHANVERRGYVDQGAPFPYPSHVDQLPIKILCVKRCSALGLEERVMYQCPDACWKQHMDAWQNERAAGNTQAMEPFPYGHLIFSSPKSHGYRFVDRRSLELREAFLQLAEFRTNAGGVLLEPSERRTSISGQYCMSLR